MKKVLVVVDMQNDFIDGSLGSPGAQAIVPRVVKKIEQYLKDDDGYVILTQDTHFEDYLKTLEGQKLPIEHCIWSSDGWKLESSIKNLVSNYDEPKVFIIPKFTFAGLELIASIYYKIIGESLSNLESIELCGLVTNICVISNAIICKSVFINTPIFVDSSCCAGTSIEAHNQALELMKNSLQIEVI